VKTTRRNFLKSLPFVVAAIPALRGLSLEPAEAESESGGALGVTPGGELIVAGNFTTAGGVSCNRIALWNGNAWVDL
jgi:hypothetical protein